MNTIRTLSIIDDDEIFVFLTKKAIQQTNLINLIKVFGNGLDAINFLKENIDNPASLPEIILLDLSMPIMDGWEFLEEYLLFMPKLSRKITIYIVTSSISPFDIVKAKSISAVTDFIIKPITKEKLIDIIKTL
ncbi:response regulator [Flavobacterium franklandianum]|uniref:Response regulator n=1 Tax=Flavobacterium franklandianum TaxID=2594430 RepID=A0A553C659_9FLAO|nr:response regulator [Flavobacterium franklandianum]TRX15892.1 response regulator [Flavobacterium franklandianum]